MYTLSVTELNMMLKFGFKSEGVAFYTHNDKDNVLSDVYRLSHLNSGYFYTSASSERDSAVSQYGFVSEGAAFRTRIGFSADNLPVYRLTLGKGYVFTTDFGERKAAMQLGYRSEGVGFFAYPTTNLGASNQIYRLAHPQGNYLYTASSVERDSAVSKYGYRYEGVVYRTP